MGRLMYAMSRRMLGEVPEPARVLRHHGRLFWVSSLSGVAAQWAMRRLDPELRELVVHRVATTVGCSWCVDFGAMLGLKAGMTTERLVSIDRYAEADCYTSLEKKAMAYADAMTGDPMTVTDEMVAELRDELGDAGVVELTSAIAFENQAARFNHALGITAQGYTSGDACPIPILTAAATERAERAPG